MPDPILPALLDAIRNGDASAHPALADWLMERNDPRAAEIREARDLNRALQVFLRHFHGRVGSRLRARGFRRHQTSARAFYFSSGRLFRGYLWQPIDLHETVTFTEFPALDLAGLLRFATESYDAACTLESWFDRPKGERVLCSFAIALVPGIDAALASRIRAGLHQWRLIDRHLGRTLQGMEVPMIFDCCAEVLHCSRKMPSLLARRLVWTKEMCQACQSTIDDVLHS